MKMNKTMLVGLALLSAVGLGLSGCTNQPVPETTGKAGTQELVFTESSNPTMSFEDESGEPLHMTEDSWMQLSEGDIEITLHGSSSCPPTVERVTKDASTVTVTLKPMETLMACTADLRGFYVTVVADDVEKVEILSNSDEKARVLPKK